VLAENDGLLSLALSSRGGEGNGTADQRVTGGEQSQAPHPGRAKTARFGFRISDLFRVSDFGFRICPRPIRPAHASGPASPLSPPPLLISVLIGCGTAGRFPSRVAALP
jgi:hypothetical protein